MTTRKDVEEMQQRLHLAHRIENPLATFKMCNEAADMLGDLMDKLEASQVKPKRTPTAASR